MSSSRPPFEIPGDELDPQKIYEEIQQRIREKQRLGIYPATDPLAEQLQAVPEEGLARRLFLLQQLSALHLPGEPIRSHRRLFGPLIVLLKKLTRFWVRKYTDAVFLQQSQYNELLSQSLRELAERLHQVEQKLASGEKPDHS